MPAVSTGGISWLRRMTTGRRTPAVSGAMLHTPPGRMYHIVAGA